jgi:hypothetical protein
MFAERNRFIPPGEQIPPCSVNVYPCCILPATEMRLTEARIHSKDNQLLLPAMLWIEFLLDETAAEYVFA